MSKDLKSTYPQIAEEWCYSKNEGLEPQDFTYGSGKLVWWKCPNGHEYQQYIKKRTLRGYNCPICSGHRTVVGINDFATVYPLIAAEWHPTRNGNNEPSMFSASNGFRAWWKCKYGHEWEATIHDRSSGTGCPYCKTRYSSSFAEQAIYYYVKKLCPDAKSRYRDCFDNGMEFDIFIPSRNVAIEYDGGYWHNSEDTHRKEAYKYRICESKGIFLIRVKEETGEKWTDVANTIFYYPPKDRKQLQNIIQGIIDTLDPTSNMFTRKHIQDYHSWITVDLDRDKDQIMDYLCEIPNSITDLRPDLIDEWNYEKNGNLTPELFGINSNERVWWRCRKCGHIWKTSIIHRAGKRNSGCPECAKAQKGATFTKRRVSERGSLADNCPVLLKQWDYEKNTINPHQITAKYNKRIWWKCDKCRYSWQASPNNRNKGVGCPCCSGRVPHKGINDLKTVNPDLASEWHPQKNGSQRPDDYLPNSGKKAWWLCKACGNEWEAVIRSRNKGSGCPACNHKRRR